MESSSRRLPHYPLGSFRARPIFPLLALLLLALCSRWAPVELAQTSPRPIRE